MKIAGLISCLLILSGCVSAPQSGRILTEGTGSLPASAELRQTPFYPQTQYQCGPAALATVLQYHGVETTPEQVSAQVYIPQRKGSLQIEMTAAARQHGMLAYQLAPELLDLFAEIAAGHPVLVLQNLGLDWYPQWHYAVVIGYDTNAREIILRSGTTRRWVTSFEVFERTWQRADLWALVIVPAGDIPITASPLPYLKAAYALEETGNTEPALKAYRSATAQWPDSAISWLALGNLAYASNTLSESVAAFHKAVVLAPASITNWNNLAYALHAYGCGDEAQKALQCALKIAPDDANLKDSRSELSGSGMKNEQLDCPLILCN